ncbi:hypothetical protein DM02DRAFT_89146 [Periconia macrospinosa]|uniref:Uncharacterized protein n=1 Tax=Periconia macrospinosa TaxID=97972 RepID=A0A2V1CWN5_9PLEO|nr:hypothetical protein DM02DRAFT_89146 [Periconia macrospinosa]
MTDGLTVASHCLQQEASVLDHEERQNNDICAVSQSQARWTKMLGIANVRQRNAVVVVKVPYTVLGLLHVVIMASPSRFPLPCRFIPPKTIFTPLARHVTPAAKRRFSSYR